MRHMKEITIRELHERTGHWVRRTKLDRVVITDRGVKRAVLIPFEDDEAPPRTLRDRKLTRAYAALQGRLGPGRALDVTDLISEDRDRE